MSHWKGSLSKVWLVIPLLSLVLLGVACGAAATATPVPSAAPQPAAAATPGPTLAAVATPVPKAAPTPTPVPVAVAKVHPGKLTIMVGELGNERFDIIFVSGGQGNRNYAKILGGYLISENERKELAPGIASQ